jgi:hypothetical protein
MEEDYRNGEERKRGGGGTFGEAEMEEWGEVC